MYHQAKVCARFGVPIVCLATLIPSSGRLIARGRPTVTEFLAAHGAVFVQRPQMRDLRPGAIFQYRFSNTRDLGSFTVEGTSLAQNSCFRPPISEVGSAWDGFTPYFTMTTDQARGWLLFGLKREVFAASKLKYLNFSFGPGTRRAVKFSDVTKLISESPAADGSGSEATQDEQCLPPLGELIGEAQRSCPSSQLLLSSIETNAIRIFFGNGRNRRSSVDAGLLQQIKTQLGEPTPIGIDEWEFHIPLIVGYERIARARVTPQRPSEAENAGHVRGWGVSGDGGGHDLLGQAEAAALAFPSGFIRVTTMGGRDIESARKSPCLR